MRVNPNPIPDILAALSQTQEQSQNALEELSTGRRVNRPSDDPGASATEVQNQASEARIDQFLQSVGSLRAMFQTADDALNSVVTALNQAVSLGVEAGNGTVTDTNRQQIAQQVQGILDQVTQLANTTFQGTYLFAGTATGSLPFTVDSSSVTYNGNSGTNVVAIADGRSLQSNLPGDQLFTNSSANVLGSLLQLTNALQSGTSEDIQNATSAVTNALSYMSAGRVFYGNALNQLDADETMLNSQNVNLQAQDTALVGADTAKAATDLSASQTAHQAALSAASRILGTTLLDYLS